MKRIAFILFILIASVHTFAQTADEIVRTKYIFDKKIPSVIDIEQSESNKRNINDGKSYLEQLLQLNKETSAVLVDTYTDSIGGFHEVYKEYYKGIEVDGSKYTLHYNKDGNIYRASGCFFFFFFSKRHLQRQQSHILPKRETVCSHQGGCTLPNVSI